MAVLLGSDRRYVYNKLSPTEARLIDSGCGEGIRFSALQARMVPMFAKFGDSGGTRTF